MKKNINSLYFHTNWYLLSLGILLLYIISFFFNWLFFITNILLLCWIIITVIDFLLLFTKKNGIIGQRITHHKHNLGEQNSIELDLKNEYSFNVHASIYEELPAIFQIRNFKINQSLPAKKSTRIAYFVRPFQRGVINFGNTLILITSPLKLVVKKEKLITDCNVLVYPSIATLKHWQIVATSNYQNMQGNKIIKKMGQSMEFDQIKDYTIGDDIRNINWKASARSVHTKVNNFIDLKSQDIYCIVDKGRNMQAKFEGMTYLDYAINAALVFSKIAIMKDDKAGLISFAHKVDPYIKAAKSHKQMNLINEYLYQLQTNFAETSYEHLYYSLSKNITNRSFCLIISNFDSLISLQRQLPYLIQINKKHLVCVVLFENTEIKALQDAKIQSIQDIYEQTIANQFDYEKRLIIKELKKHGIIGLLTTPSTLTANVINKYLELKHKQAI